MEIKLEGYKKDKMVTLRLSPLDIYEINYIAIQSWEAKKTIYSKCTDLLNSVVYDLCDDIEKAEDKRKFIYHLISKREKLMNKKTFKSLTQAKVLGTELATSKPYNVYLSSEILSTIQDYLIEYTEVQRPHSSWITHLALTNTFTLVAKAIGEFDFDPEDNLIGEPLEEMEKIDLIERFVKLFKADDINADKIKRIKAILDE